MSFDNKNDWSIDLETLDNKYSSAILSIGAVQFDRESGELGCRFYQEINIDSAVKSGTISGSTLEWWMGQGAEAREVFKPGREKMTLANALHELATLMRAKGGGAPRPWGNGASFDITILEHAYDKGCIGLVPPWQYFNIRDMRTTMDDADISLGGLPSVGTAHNALDDAIFQSQCISLARRRIRRALGFTLPPWAGLPEFAAHDGAPTKATAPAKVSMPSKPAKVKKAAPPPDYDPDIDGPVIEEDDEL